MAPDNFIALISEAAKQSFVLSKVPASFTIAQASLKSGWGERAIGMNLFCIKADSNWNGMVDDVHTHEVIKGVSVAVVVRFRKYNSWLESINDHSKFLTCNPRYRNAFCCTSVADFTRDIASSGYATDPNYASIINAIIDRHNLTRFDV